MSLDINSGVDPYTGLAINGNGGTEIMFRQAIQTLPQKYLDKFQIVCSRVNYIDPNKKLILYCHDTYDDPHSLKLKQEDVVAKIEHFVFVSNYQFNTFHLAYGIPYNKSSVILNAIEPITDTKKPNPNKQLRMIYHTTPHRGLHILIPVFEKLQEEFDNLHLDVFSSFQAYGWGEKDHQFRNLFERCRRNPNIEYHGYQPNHVVREYLKQAHMFPFPSIWPETSCIAAIEAMSAGCLVISSDLAALPETVADFGVMYRYDENIGEHANKFYNIMRQTIKKFRNKDFNKHLNLLQNHVNIKHDIKKCQKTWIDLLERLDGKS